MYIFRIPACFYPDDHDPIIRLEECTSHNAVLDRPGMKPIVLESEQGPRACNLCGDREYELDDLVLGWKSKDTATVKDELVEIRVGMCITCKHKLVDELTKSDDF